ncbi:MAG: DUF4493 domain-containing protein, partial [Bacteroidaceae bacterium]|nr:DUF4493 domain-containing protein [Bacteroidaceae bacterium]
DLAEMTAGGGIHLTLGEAVEVETRATPAQLGKPLAEQFNLQVVNTGTQRVVFDGKFQEVVKAGNGTYKITATYGEDLLLAVDKPYYQGEATTELTAETPNPQVEIACRVANALLSVKFLDKDGNESTAAFDDYFTTYAVRVMVQDSYVLLADAGQSAYFRAGSSPKVTFVGTLRDTGREVQFDVDADKVPTNMQAAQHAILKMQMQESTEGVVLNVTKADVEIVTISQTMPLEWLPAPKVASVPAEQLVFETSTSVPAAVIPFTTSSALQDAELTVTMEDNNWTSLNGTYLLSTLTEEQRQALQQAGIQLPALGQTYDDGTLAFDTLAMKLKTNAGTLTRNTISWRVKANNRWSGTPVATTMKVARPDITLPAQLQEDAWTKTFYITALQAANVDGKGLDATEVLPYVQYEVSTDGGNTWSVVETTAELGKQKATGLQPVTSYLLRASLKETAIVTPTTASFTTEEELAVPNGDFEELTEAIKIEDMEMGGQYGVYAAFFKFDYQNKLSFTLSNPNGWDTNNGQTCNYDGAATKNTWFVVPSTFNTNCYAHLYQDFGGGVEGTTHTKADLFADREAQNGSNAMVIQNVAWSLGGTKPALSGGQFNTTYYCENAPDAISDRSAGTLYLKDEQGEGNSFASRPTKLQLYYKYENAKAADERGKAVITLLNGSEVVASAEGKFAAQSEWTQATVELTYHTMTRRADRLRIQFVSTDASTIQTENVTSWYQCSYGAQLTVDNLTFVYDR